MALKKFTDLYTNTSHLEGKPVYLVTRKGEIVEGFRIAKVFIDQVLLDRPPIEETPKQGFQIEGDILKPTWCLGRKTFYGAFLDRKKAEQFVAKRKRSVS